MGHTFRSNTVSPCRVNGQAKGNGVDGHLRLSTTPAPRDRFLSASRIPRLICKAALHSTSIEDSSERISNLNDQNNRGRGYCPHIPAGPSNGRATRHKGYLAPTFASIQRQRARRAPGLSPERSGPVNSASTTKRPTKQKNVSKIPVLSNKRLRKSPAGSAIPSRPSLSHPLRTPVSHQLRPYLPPPQYSERPELPRQPCMAGIRPASPIPYQQTPPVYLEHTSELEYELYICSNPPKGLDASEATGPSLKFVSGVRPKLPCVLVRKALHTPTAQASSTRGKLSGKEIELSRSWFGKRVSNLIEELSDDPELDELSRAILRDIFMVLDSNPSARAIALYAYVRD